MRTKKWSNTVSIQIYWVEMGEKVDEDKGSVIRNRKIEPKVSGNWKGASEIS